MKRKYEKHGMSKTRPFYAYYDMIARCLKPGSADYEYYGGRGITICDSWQSSFIAWNNYMKELPGYDKKGYWIDRIDNDGNYEPGNVRWTTPSQSGLNRRKWRIRGPHTKEHNEKIRQGNLAFQRRKRGEIE